MGEEQGVLETEGWVRRPPWAWAFTWDGEQRASVQPGDDIIERQCLK